MVAHIASQLEEVAQRLQPFSVPLW
jgi:hypothetical protein